MPHLPTRKKYGFKNCTKFIIDFILKIFILFCMQLLAWVMRKWRLKWLKQLVLTQYYKLSLTNHPWSNRNTHSNCSNRSKLFFYDGPKLPTTLNKPFLNDQAVYWSPFISAHESGNSSTVRLIPPANIHE
jgi:hypothetical protein